MHTQNTMDTVHLSSDTVESKETIIEKILSCITDVKRDVKTIQNIPPELLQLKNTLGEISQIDRSFSSDFNPYLRCETVDELFQEYESIKRSNSNSTRVKHLALLKFACNKFS